MLIHTYFVYDGLIHIFAFNNKFGETSVKRALAILSLIVVALVVANFPT
jgi:hypothetical protein